VQTPEGSVTFQGELNEEEASFVIQVGLNTLLEHGAIPFTSVAPEDIQEPPESLQ